MRPPPCHARGAWFDCHAAGLFSGNVPVIPTVLCEITVSSLDFDCFKDEMTLSADRTPRTNLLYFPFSAFSGRWVWY